MRIIVIFTAILCCLVTISTPVLANNETIQPLWQGEVTAAYYNSTRGKVLIIAHTNGFETRYSGVDMIFVTPGQKVSSSDTIAFTRSSSPSTKIEIYKDGKLLLVSPIK